MFRKLKPLVFAAGMAAGGALLWHHSAATWGRLEEYSVAGTQTLGVGSGDQAAYRVALRSINGDWRDPLDVPAAVHESVRDGDFIRIQVRRIPILYGEMLQYTLVRAAVPVSEWSEGHVFFGLSLVVGALAAGVALLGIYLLAGAVFRWQAPTE